MIFENSDEIVGKKKELEQLRKQRDILIDDKTLAEEEFRKRFDVLSEKIRQIKRMIKEKRYAFLLKCNDNIL